MSLSQRSFPDGPMLRTAVALLAVAFAVASSSAALAYSKRTRAIANTDVRQLMRLMDTDKNGSISKDEFMQFMAQKFDRLDADKSGQLEAKELSGSSLPVSKRADAAGTSDVRQLVRLMDCRSQRHGIEGRIPEIHVRHLRSSRRQQERRARTQGTAATRRSELDRLPRLAYLRRVLSDLDADELRSLTRMSLTRVILAPTIAQRETGE